jgi:methionyl-tRNA synthetase
MILKKVSAIIALKVFKNQLYSSLSMKDANNTGKKFYITTTLPYVNSDPHIGFAMEIIRADIVARYKKNLGYDVFFNTGTDEHGTQKKGVETQVYVDEYAARFKGLKDVLGISTDVHFIRTTDEHHIKAAQAFWTICDQKGYIYKKEYKVKYCVGCELDKTDSELVDGKCPIHPNRDIELREESSTCYPRFSFQ